MPPDVRKGLPFRSNFLISPRGCASQWRHSLLNMNISPEKPEAFRTSDGIAEENNGSRID